MSILTKNNVNPLIGLVIVNIAVYVLLFITQIVMDGSTNGNSLIPYVSLHNPFSFNLTHFYTFFTFGISHLSIWHLIGNLIWLFTFGQILQDFIGKRHLLPTFLYGNFIAAIVFLLLLLVPWKNNLAGNQMLIGAGPGVMAIATATILTAPDYRFFPQLGGGIPMWLIGILYFLLQAATAYQFGIAHLLALVAAALMGVLYLRFLRKGKDLSNWMYNILEWWQNLLSKNNKPVTQSSYYKENSKRPPVVKKPNFTQKRIDALLDKISEQGMGSLTDEERAFLKNLKHKGDL
jgi:membrane associated rhomboid family serine protease